MSTCMMEDRGDGMMACVTLPDGHFLAPATLPDGAAMSANTVAFAIADGGVLLLVRTKDGQGDVKNSTLAIV